MLGRPHSGAARVAASIEARTDQGVSSAPCSAPRRHAGEAGEYAAASCESYHPTDVDRRGALRMGEHRVDIQFSDVMINGGRPRVEWDEPYCRTDDVCDEFSSSYVSDNVPPGDITPPVGDIIAPQTGEYITNNKL